MAISTRTRFEILKRDNFTCRYCGRKPPVVVLHVDHIVPASRGGSDDRLNLAASCFECNAGKSAIPLSDVVSEVEMVKNAEDSVERASLIIAAKRAAELSEEIVLDDFRWLDANCLIGGSPVVERAVLSALRKHPRDMVLDAILYINRKRGRMSYFEVPYFWGILRNKSKEGAK